MKNSSGLSWPMVYFRRATEVLARRSKTIGHPENVESGSNVKLRANLILNICPCPKRCMLQKTYQLFDKMPEPNLVTYNSLISGLSQHGFYKESISLFIQMQRSALKLLWIRPNAYTFVSVLSSCADLALVHKGKQAHAHIIRNGSKYDLFNVFISNSLIDMYCKCGDMKSAKILFETYSWIEIKVTDFPRRALEATRVLLGKIRLHGIEYQRTFVISNFMKPFFLFHHIEIDCHIVKLGLLDNIFTWNSIITALLKSGFMDDASRIFDSMPERDQCSWNSMVSGFAQHERFGEALEYFVELHRENFVLNEYSFGSALSACAGLKDLKVGIQIHAILSKSRYSSDVYMGSALVDMYGKCGHVSCAQKVFDRMTHRNIVSWNSLITCYEQNGPANEALEVFLRMMHCGIGPDEVTLASVVSACASLAAIKVGLQIHTRSVSSGEEPDIFVGNSLIDMYMKCGSVEDGCRVFETMVERDWVSWNAMIVGYAQNGYGTEALGLFKKMLVSGEKPDHVTMIGVLCACSHAGLVAEGRHYFVSMSKEHGLIALKDHYTCMVDLLGRAGCLDEAKDLIEAMPMQPDAVIWGSLLAACKVHRNINLGEYVAEKLLEIDPTNSGPYVLLSNMYAELGRWGDVIRVRRLMRKRGVIKQPGCSWIEIQGDVNVFMVKDKRHPQKKDIYLVLKMLTKQMKRVGYVANADDYEASEEESDIKSTSNCQMDFSVDAIVG
ncbi:hypothetical protein JRO89_XS08G0084400 [Xanthoceras sorbifolium]|uniref:Pentatricopeptide repeat-containing protein n=1 Tax=Xanthoceras sorbifolium TaxID=99658 RepID=A0ABQ8HPA0_9ROSI|nr:hypothetical protein JRO89_XS08G0084400 [Xanthoceras sorbifolium]